MHVCIKRLYAIERGSTRQLNAFCGFENLEEYCIRLRN